MERTIAAISTPQGNGGIAVIRISGNDAIKVADKVFFGSKKLADCDTHTVHYGFIKNEKGEKVDEVLATVMLAPKTFTREDVVEISTHGGSTASRAVLDTIIRAGAYMAEPGVLLFLCYIFYGICNIILLCFNIFFDNFNVPLHICKFHRVIHQAL